MLRLRNVKHENKNGSARDALVDVKEELKELKDLIKVFSEENKWRESFYEANYKLLNKIESLEGEVLVLKAKLSKYE